MAIKIGMACTHLIIIVQIKSHNSQPKRINDMYTIVARNTQMREWPTHAYLVCRASVKFVQSEQ